MKIAVHRRPDQGSDTWSTRWIEALEKHNVEVLTVDLTDTEVIDKVKNCDGVMWHWIHYRMDDKMAAPKILSAIEHGLGKPVFPDARTCWHYDDKVAQHYLLEAVESPCLKSWVFWTEKDALDFLEKCAYPVIFKLSVGAGSANVLKVDSKSEGSKLVSRLFSGGLGSYRMNEFARVLVPRSKKDLLRMKSRAVVAAKSLLGQDTGVAEYKVAQRNYAYFQEFAPGNTHDIRITVIGNRAFGYIRHNRPGDFRASGSGNIEYDTSNIPIEAVAIAHEVSKRIGSQSMAYDFLRRPNGDLAINEISYCYVSKYIHTCSGYWDRELQWHPGNFWPEEAHVEDFIELVRGRRV